MRAFGRFGLTAVLILATAGTAAAQGQQRRGGPGMGMRGMGGFAGLLNLRNVLQDEETVAALNLSANQKTEITAITAAFDKDNAEDLIQMQKFSEEMAALRSGGGRPDRDAMMAIVQKYQEPQERLRPATKKLQSDVEVVLKDDQKKKLHEKLEARGPRRRP